MLLENKSKYILFLTNCTNKSLNNIIIIINNNILYVLTMCVQTIDLNISCVVVIIMLITHWKIKTPDWYS